jgi:hypothetical protein
MYVDRASGEDRERPTGNAALNHHQGLGPTGKYGNIGRRKAVLVLNARNR